LIGTTTELESTRAGGDIFAPTPASTFPGRIIVQTVVTEKMKPAPQVIATIDIGRVGEEEAKTITRNSANSKARAKTQISRLMKLMPVVFYLGAPPLTGTAIVGLRTPDQVVIAADGLRGIINDNGVVVSRTTACKIYQEGRGVYMAAAGVSFKMPPIEISFDAPLLGDTLRERNLHEEVRAAINAFDLKTRNAWRIAESLNRPFFSAAIAEHATQLIFGWTDGTELGAASYSAIPLPDGTSSRPEWAIYPSSDIPSETPLVWMVGGEASERMRHTLEGISNRTIKLPTDLPAFARGLIKDEIKADQTHRLVGYPIDVLVVKRIGTQWYRPDTESKCPPIAPRKRPGK
jgi:hypothetical protein